MDKIMKTAIRFTLIWVAVIMMIGVLVTDFRTITVGLIVGSVVSVMNALLLQRRINLLGQIVESQTPRRMGLGFGSRIATVLIAVMFAYRYPEILNLPAVLVGSFIVQITSFFVAIWVNKRENG